MAQFTVNQNRIDPYKNFKFLIRFEGVLDPVAGVSKVSTLKRTTEVVSHRDGGDLSTPRHAPGSTKFEAITLERGVTFDLAFEQWANLVFDTKGPGGVSLKNYKRNLYIDVLNLQGIKVKSYKVLRAWVSEYVALPDLDANANAILLEHVVVQNEGWERDVTVKEAPEF